MLVRVSWYRCRGRWNEPVPFAEWRHADSGLDVGQPPEVEQADLQIRRRRLDALARQIDSLNPLGILARGYALLSDAESGKVIASIAQATPGLRVTARVKDGTFPATVGGR